MTATALTGCIIVGAVVIFINVLVFWSSRTIDRIAKNGSQHLRAILRERRGER